MREKIVLFFKGIVLGFSFILPGVSGGVLALTMGIYEKLIKTISHFFDDFKENFKFSLNIGLGMFVSVIICALALDFAFEHFPIPTILLFLGLIIGGIPLLLNKVKGTFKISNFIILIIGVLLLFVLTMINDGGDVILKNLSFLGNIKLFFVGFLSAATIVVPGISGSFVLMAMGYYHPLLSVVSEIIKFNNLFSNILIMLPLGIGLMAGILVMVKVIEYFLEKHETKTYYIIIGFVLSSVIKVVFSVFDYTLNSSSVIIGIILFAVGAFISLRFFQEK